MSQRKCLLDGVHIGATWRIRLNRPGAGSDAAFLSNHFDSLFFVAEDDLAQMPMWKSYCEYCFTYCI